jgi:hypothetical protein
MSDPNCSNDSGLTRRGFLGAAAAVVASLLTGCSSLRILMKAYPDKFDEDPELRHRFFVSFIDAIVPGSAGTNGNAARVYSDDFYAFNDYSGYFLSALARTTNDVFGHENFDRLDRAGCTAVISRGVNKNGPDGKLYSSAIFMAQFSYYGGIYDDELGCPLIDFPGANGGFKPNTMSITEIEQHLAASLTTNGNPV